MKTSKSTRTGCELCLVVLLSVVLGYLTGCASKGKISNFYLNPADGDRALFTYEGVTITSRYLDEDDQVQFLRLSGRDALSREIRELPLSTFLLEIVNKNSSEVILDPASIRFVTGAGPMLSPVSYAHLYMALPRGEGRQTVLQELQGITFDRPVTVPSGGREEGLIFFQRPEKVARDVAVVLGGLYLGGAQQKAVLSFKAVPLEE